jgi:twitching motility protein PilT
MIASLAPVRLSEALLIARTANASDLHLCGGRVPVMRIDGKLESQPGPSLSSEDVATIASKLLPEAAHSDLATSGDVSVTYRHDVGGSIRVHAYRTSDGLTLAMRLLSPTVPALESLNLPGAVGGFAERAAGLVLLAGPTGSGKTTALAAIVDSINRTKQRHIITIEDPIEYEHRSNRSVITQRQVGAHVPSFVQAIYGALRSDPDVLVIGEMRDPSTMQAAITAAETGHLVFATLHTGDAPQTIDRIIGVFPHEGQQQIRMQLAQTLLGIVCMRLLPRAAGHGRCCAAEVLVANDAVRATIRDGKTHQLRNIVATSRQAGMQTLEAHLSELVALREITLESARAFAGHAADIRVERTVA